MTTGSWMTDDTFSLVNVQRGGIYHTTVKVTIDTIQDLIRSGHLNQLTWMQLVDECETELMKLAGTRVSYITLDRYRACREECLAELDVNTAAMTTWYLFHPYHTSITAPKPSPFHERIHQPYCE